MAYDEAKPTWWAWVTISPFLLGVMLVGFGRLLAQNLSVRSVLGSLFFFSAFAVISRGHRKAWQARPGRYGSIPQLRLAAGCFALGVVVVLAALASEGVSLG
jgi:drug/metabolite transporter (DMT)-like permease